MQSAQRPPGMRVRLPQFGQAGSGAVASAVICVSRMEISCHRGALEQL
jgi:hypothetical protein